MKKKLEADLISIAHRILKLKNKSDINQLYLETQKLYEKLAVLKFIDENFDAQKPTIGRTEIESQIETIFEKVEETPVETKIEIPVVAEETVIEENFEPEIIEEIVAETEEQIEETVEEVEEEKIPEPVLKTIEEPIEEKTEEPFFEEAKATAVVEEISFSTKSDFNPIPDFKPAFELETIAEEEVIEEKLVEEKIANKAKPVQISFEDIIGVNYADAHFVKVDSFEAITPAPSINEFKEKTVVETEVLEKAEPKVATLNEKLAKGFHVDLNDRIAFTKNLFGGSSEDYSRVLNQLLTFDTYGEAHEFIENMVKPDYNNWEGKDDYAERFLGIIEKKFS